jgi:hypothetical protein
VNLSVRYDIVALGVEVYGRQDCMDECSEPGAAWAWPIPAGIDDCDLIGPRGISRRSRALGRRLDRAGRLLAVLDYLGSPCAPGFPLGLCGRRGSFGIPRGLGLATATTSASFCRTSSSACACSRPRGLPTTRTGVQALPVQRCALPRTCR